MAELRTFRCRYNPWLPTRELKTWHVRVKWWAYDNDRLDGRGDAKMTEAQVSVKAYSQKEARNLVFREWGHHAAVGTAVENTSS